MVIVVLTRAALYDLDWSVPMVTLSKTYEISDTGLRKICKRMNIPLPKTGHWQKLQYGKRVIKFPLPQKNLGEQEVELPLRWDGSDYSAGPQSPVTRLRKDIEQDPTLSLIVSARLSSPDKLVHDAKEALANRKDSEHYRFPDLLNCSNGNLEIRVSAQDIGRALRFMDTLIKALRARGHDVQVGNRTYAVVFEERLEFSGRKRKRSLK
jgi:hypothetical protein